MSVKSQLNASRDFILTGMRAAARVQTQNPGATKILRGCLDLIETLERQPAENLTITDIETTLNVLHQSMTEIDDETPQSTAFVQSIKNAAGRLMDLRRELATK
jgi:small-conductance mechanosensitive channel